MGRKEWRSGRRAWTAVEKLVSMFPWVGSTADTHSSSSEAESTAATGSADVLAVTTLERAPPCSGYQPRGSLDLRHQREPSGPSEAQRPARHTSAPWKARPPLSDWQNPAQL